MGFVLGQIEMLDSCILERIEMLGLCILGRIEIPRFKPKIYVNIYTGKVFRMSYTDIYDDVLFGSLKSPMLCLYLKFSI